MTFLPVVERELRTALRRPVLRWSRVAVAVAAALIVGLALAFTAAAPIRAGSGVFRFVVLLLFFYVSLAGVGLTADCLSVERREGTLGLLFLTRLKGYDVVLGKLAAQSVTAFYGWLAALPMLAISMLMGGVTGGEFWRITLILASTLWLSLTIGLVVSSMARGQQVAMVLTFLAVLVLNVGGPMLTRLLPGSAWDRWLPGLLSPAWTCLSAFDSPYRANAGIYWSGLLSAQLIAWSSLGLACWILPRYWREERESRTSPPPRGRRGKVGKAAGVALARRGRQRNPVSWLARRTVLMSPTVLWATTSATVAVLGFAPQMLSGQSRVWVAEHIGWIVGLVLRVIMVFQASRFFLESRRTGALELLLSTPLSPRDIVEGQLAALRRLFWGPAVLVAAVYFWPLALGGWLAVSGVSWSGTSADHALVGAVGAYRTVELAADLYAAAWLSLLMGLASRHAGRVPFLAVIYVVVLPSVAACIPSILIDLPIIFLAQDRLRREFTLLARRPYELGSSRWGRVGTSRSLMPPPLPPRTPSP